MGGTVLHVNAVGLMAAIEENKDRSLRARPFVVAHEGLPRSVVLDLSPEAHREGVRRGMMLSLASRIVSGLIVKAPRPELYREADEEMWKTGMSFTPLVERAGQGHLFIDLAGTSRLHGSPEDACQKLRSRLMERTGIMPCLALASGKTVTKVATRVFRPGGFIALLPHEERRLLRLQPVELLPGVGPVLKDRLYLLDIEDIGGLADLGSFEARALGPRGPDLVARARCTEDSPVDPEPPERRFLKAEVLFEPDTADAEAMRLRCVQLAVSLGFAVRKDSLGTRKVSVRLDYGDGKSSSASVRAARLAVRDDEIAAAACAAAARAFSRRVRVRRLSLELSEFSAAGPELDLFEPAESRSARLQTALDRVHGKYGFGALSPCAFLAAGLFPAGGVGR